MQHANKYNGGDTLTFIIIMNISSLIFFNQPYKIRVVGKTNIFTAASALNSVILRYYVTRIVFTETKTSVLLVLYLVIP